MSSIFSARQYINHYAGIMVNGQVISKSNYILKIGDIVSIKNNLRRRIRRNLIIKNIFYKFLVFQVQDLEINYKILKIIVMNKNDKKKIFYPFKCEITKFYKFLH